MKAINPYLTFDGNCNEAMTFYSKALGGNLTMQTFKDVGMDKPGAGDRIMHARIDKGTGSAGSMSEGASALLMASDSQPGDKVSFGDNIWLAVDCDGNDEQDRVFAALSEGGKVVMPLDNTFWGARFGMLKDKYGIGWMLNNDIKK